MNEAPETTLPEVAERAEAMNLPTIAGDIYSNPKAFEHAQRVGRMVAESQFIPDLYKKNVADCTLAVIMAQQLGVHPLVFMHEVSAVRGRPCPTGKFVVALINKAGVLEGDLDWEYEGNGDARSCKAYGTRRADGKKLVGNPVSVKMAKDAGWWERNPQWKIYTDQMLCYRSSSFFQKQYFPQLTLGMMTQEEMIDIGEGVQVVKPPSQSASLSKKLRGE